MDADSDGLSDTDIDGRIVEVMVAPEPASAASEVLEESEATSDPVLTDVAISAVLPAPDSVRPFK